MKISYQTILSNQNFIPELFSDIRWQELDIDQKKEIIYPIFHIKNWRQLNPEYRIYFLQEVENINASMQKRNACKLVLKDNMEGSIHTGPEGSEEIYISSNYVLNGRKYHVILEENGTNTYEEENLENENVYLFCSVCHEGEHMKQKNGIKSDINTKEINECSLNLLANPDKKEENNRIDASEYPIFYKLQPVEYYAFLNSETMTKTVFSMLQTKFGVDEGFDKWNQEINLSNFEALAHKWNIDNNMKKTMGIEYTVTGLRKQLIKIMLDNIQKWYNIDGIFKVCDYLNLDYHDYLPKIKDDWILDSKIQGEL